MSVKDDVPTTAARIVGNSSPRRTGHGDIAIVGMAADVPGAPDIAAFWANLTGSVESVTRLSREAVLEAGEDPARAALPNYVPAAAIMDGYADFDAEFFGFGPREAAILDPQHRKFLEVTWAAMEQAGHAPRSFDGRIGVYAGCGQGSYFHDNIRTNPDLVEDVGLFLLRHTGNDKDFLSTRVSHIFDLKGPSVTMQTACSTSLVAVHYARQALMSGECDMALAGGVTIELPHARGYLYKENEILSPDGHCRAFDARAAGTIFGSGAGAVALRRLEDAIADGDHIWAVIKGSAINNDGAAKAGYLAPSVEGQAAAIRAALRDAEVDAASIGYVECHGTGTYLGDPIEVAALAEAHGAGPACHIGSVKSNIGHLDTAAGVVGLIKAALSVHHGQIAPSLNFDTPNPAIDFAGSRFAVADRLLDWSECDRPRRAAVNSLGVGGTNAHVILEQAPQRAAPGESDFPFHIMTLSARSDAALNASAATLAAHLRAHPNEPLADIAYTLHEGRHVFGKRRVLVAETHEEAAHLLETDDPLRVFNHTAPEGDPDLVFMFPGGGAQYPGMARDLYETEPVFAEWMDRGLDHLAPQLEYDIRALWLPAPGDEAAAAAALTRPSVQLPLIMITEYALAQMWLGWGLRPAALVGHSMGENTAAALAGVMSFEDCIDLVLLRGRLFDTVAPGGMLSISLPVEELAPLIGADLDIASVNAPGLCAVSGPQEALDALAQTLAAKDIDYSRVAIDIAAHSQMLDGILPQYRAHLAAMTLAAPQIPIMSNCTGAELTEAQATDPDYWTGQLRQTVHFAKCIDTLAARPAVFLEVGPGRALASLAQMGAQVRPGHAISTLRHPDHAIADDLHLMGVIGRLSALNQRPDWDQIWGDARRNRVLLPGYPFQRSRYFIEPGKTSSSADTTLIRNDNMQQWGYVPRWRPAHADCDLETAQDLGAPQVWLIFEDAAGVAAPVITALREAGHTVTTVQSGDSFQQRGEGAYILAPEQGREGYEALMGALAADGRLPRRIAHFWGVTGEETYRPGSSFFDRNMEHGFYSLAHLAQGMGAVQMLPGCHLTVITSGALQVAGEGATSPEKACALGPVGVIPREFPSITASLLDIERPVTAQRRRLSRAQGAANEHLQARTSAILRELLAEPSGSIAALRDGVRMERVLRHVALDPASGAPPYVQGGLYLITGGVGGLGLAIARDIARRAQAHIVLLSRRPLPPRDQWARHQGDSPVAARIAAIEEIEALGGRVTCLTADVTDLVQMQNAREAIDKIGKLSGIIHAAGVVDDAPILAKDDSAMQAVLAPKIAGLRVLDEVFPDGSPDMLVLFSSTSTATTPAGQVDYVAANAYLDAVAAARQGGQTRVICVNWGVWAETGMAASAMARRMGTEPEVEARPLEAPMLRSISSAEGGPDRFAISLSAEDDWIFSGHRTRLGDALLPGTAMIELAAEAMAADGPFQPFELRDLGFLRPFTAEAGAPQEGELRLHATDSQAAALSLRRSISLDGRAGHVLTAEAEIRPLAAPAPRIAPDEIEARCTQRTGSGFVSPQEAHMVFGPRWRVVTRTATGPREGLAHLALPEEFGADLEAGYLAHPALLDLATGWAIGLHEGCDAGDLWVPAGYAALRLYRPLPARIVSWIRLADGCDADTAVFDVTLATPDGAVVMEARGFTMRRLATSALKAIGRPPAPRDVVFEDAASAPPLSAAETRLMRQIALGITPAEGPEALHRALALAASGQTHRIAISPFDLNAQIAEAAAPPAESATSASFERPRLEGDYVAPQEGTEAQLAEIWSTLLGIGEVGAHDSFFDLGGHSLLAVRLFAQVKQRHGVDFPLSVLFEAPTIAALAARIDSAGGTAAPVEALEADDATQSATVSEASAAPQHLVALHPGTATGHTPLFIVAGMFGNVLNLRQLALLVGRDRPVWGLQARGLIGDAEPHDLMEEAAADYIAEMRSVQPNGPYYLAGFSGGGITALEVAQQLRAEGQEVGLLALLDTPLPQRPQLTRRDKALIKMQEIRRKGPRYAVEWAANRLAWERARRRAPAAAPSADGSFNNAAIEAAFRRAAARYRPRLWAGPMTLFRPKLDRHWTVSGGASVSAEREYVLPDNGWTDYCSQLKVIEVPGDHDSMVLVPNVGVLAGHLTALAAAADMSGSADRSATSDDDDAPGWASRTAAE